MVLIETDPEASEELGHFEHVLVDEIQDLVDARAELVKAVLLTPRAGSRSSATPPRASTTFSSTTARHVRSGRWRSSSG